MVAYRSPSVSRSFALASALTVVTLADASASAQNSFPIVGTIRDFHRTDPAINAPPSGGNGLYTGNIALNLSAQGRPMFVGLYEDNDPRKRLMIVCAYNQDMSEFWERSDEGYAPVAVNNEAYKIGVNLFMYGITH